MPASIAHMSPRRPWIFFASSRWSGARFTHGWFCSVTRSRILSPILSIDPSLICERSPRRPSGDSDRAQSRARAQPQGSPASDHGRRAVAARRARIHATPLRTVRCSTSETSASTLAMNVGNTAPKVYVSPSTNPRTYSAR